MEIINVKKEKKEEIIKKVLAVLKKGGLVIYPTETCYGIGADATNSRAIKKLLEFKGYHRKKPISVACADKAMAPKYVEINEVAQNLYKRFLPGPLTVVSRSRNKTVSDIESINGTLGIRIPDYPLVREIIRRFKKPITSTSANTSGKKTPYCLGDVLKYTSKKRQNLVSIFLDDGKLPFRPPSTVVDTTLNEPAVLRRGEIRIPEVEGQVFVSDSETKTKLIAKKIFSRHKKSLNKKVLIFALQGELGSGKTRFVKGLARALNICANIVSPTFVLIREYPYCFEKNSGILYHIDTWRIEKGQELWDLGLKKILRPGNVIAIEWLQKVRPILEGLKKNKKIQIIWVVVEHLSETKRRISYLSK